MRTKVINDLPPGKSHAIPDDIAVSVFPGLKEQPETERIAELRKGVSDMLRHKTDGASMPELEPYRPPSRQPGYVQRNRLTTVAMQTHIPKALRDEVNAVAKAAGMTAQVFLAKIIRDAVQDAKKDPKVAKVLKAQADAARKLEDPDIHQATRAAAFKHPSPT